MKSLADAACKAEILARIGALEPDSPRCWGIMTAPQMLCHLSDSYLAMLGEKYISLAPGLYPRALYKSIALRSPFRWPRGITTRPEVNQALGGTPPEAFESDRRRLLALVERFTAEPPGFVFAPHPMFGVMSHGDCMRWGYLHADHHLRQFSE